MHKIYQVDEYLSSLILLIIISLTVIAVGLRYLFNSPIAWIEEALIMLYIWLIMIGAVSGIKARKHISIDAINMILSKKQQRLLQLFNDFVTLVVLLIFAYVGYQLAKDAITKITPILGISYYYIDLAIPVGSIWMSIHLIIIGYQNYKRNI